MSLTPSIKAGHQTSEFRWMIIYTIVTLALGILGLLEKIGVKWAIVIAGCLTALYMALRTVLKIIGGIDLPPIGGQGAG